MNHKNLNILILNIIILFTGSIGVVSQTLEDQVIEIGNELMCPVCQGQSVAESNSGLAIDMRSIIKEKLENGESKEEIISYFKTRYGDSILGAPPAKGVGYLLWLLPILSLSIGVFIIFKSIRSYKKPKEYSDKIENSSEYMEKLEQELENKD